MPDPQLPVPTPTLDNLEFWQGAKRRELLLQRCVDCGNHTFPPRPGCVVCGSTRREWVRASGRGKVHSFVVTHQPVHPALRGKTPWGIVDVELEEGVHMISNVVGCAPDDLRIGLPVEVVFEDVSEEIAVPRFRVVA